MPRNINPKDIKTGPGQTVPGQEAGYTLDNWSAHGSGGGGDASVVMAALKAHINDPKDAHPASAIGLEPIPPLVSDNTETALQDAVAGLVWEPPQLGKISRHCDLTGVPDWGALKLDDTPIFLRDPDFDDLVNTNDFREIFPYFLLPLGAVYDWNIYNYDDNYAAQARYSPGYLPNVPWSTPAFDGKVQNTKYNIRLYQTVFPDGGDPFSDRMFNYSNILGGANPSPLKSGGRGRCYSGGFTRDDGYVQRTTRIMEFDSTDITYKWPMLATVSGVLYPADRGVLALLHFPHIGNPSSTDPWSTERRDAFLAQDILDRCIGALLLGQGILGDACIGLTGDKPCDGDPGGIFGIGADEKGNYNPYTYPGRASGQYNLEELHRGTTESTPHVNLNPPWDNLTGQGAGMGAKRAHYTGTGDSYYPAAGQVRLGSDADAGIPILPWGIPILGANITAYMDNVSIPPLTDYPMIRHLGRIILEPNFTNFFKFRLPVLDDYSKYMGMKHTPHSRLSSSYGETSRYLDRSTTVVPEKDPYTTHGGGFATRLDVAGNYPPFPEDCITWQIARYRFSFMADGGNDTFPGNGTPLGSYALFHFKTEKDFEALVRDGVMPEDVYGAHFMDGTGQDNVVNVFMSTTYDPEYIAPAPAGGLSALFYHNIRNELYVGGPASSHRVDRGDIDTFYYDWTVPTPGSSPGVMFVSGVGYYTPRKLIGTLPHGTASFQIKEIAVEVENAWVGGYRTDDAPLVDPHYGTIITGDPPALESSPCPGMLSMRCFGNDLSNVLPVSYPGTWYRRNLSTVEFPFTYLGANGGGTFSWTNGPLAADTLSIQNTDQFEIYGDSSQVSFSTDAKPWFYIRRPLAHGTNQWEDVIQPSWDATNGHGFALESVDTNNVLLHTTGFYTEDPSAGPTHGGYFGNFTKSTFVTVDGYQLYDLFDDMMVFEKDVAEVFLDEAYRYERRPPSTSDSDINAIFSMMTGPGMRGWVGGPVPLPVQIGKYHGAGDYPPPWDTYPNINFISLMGWCLRRRHAVALTDASLQDELQVAGLPARNPAVLDWATEPFPSAGLLKYPTTNYTTGYRPNVGDDAVTQPDYTGQTQTRSFVRMFDVAFSRSISLPPWDAAGQPFVVLRIDGITLEDFQYTTPGPGTTASATAPKIAIMIKVPGLTTWMDAGRPDGGGPSKQDPSQDGAGCQVVGPYTFNSIDQATGMVYCQVKVNVGPAANLATGMESVSGLYEVPVGVKVIMGSMAAGEYDLVGGGAGTKAADVRGITGIRIVHPYQIETAP